MASRNNKPYKHSYSNRQMPPEYFELAQKLHTLTEHNQQLNRDLSSKQNEINNMAIQYTNQQKAMQEQANKLNQIEAQMKQMIQTQNHVQHNDNTQSSRQLNVLSHHQNQSHFENDHSQNQFQHIFNTATRMDNIFEDNMITSGASISRNYIHNITLQPPKHTHLPLTPPPKNRNHNNKNNLRGDQVVCVWDKRIITVSDHQKYANGRRVTIHKVKWHPKAHNSVDVNYKGTVYTCKEQNNYSNNNLGHAINTAFGH